jgi:hypothetical protein
MKDNIDAISPSMKATYITAGGTGTCACEARIAAPSGPARARKALFNLAFRRQSHS